MEVLSTLNPCEGKGGYILSASYRDCLEHRHRDWEEGTMEENKAEVKTRKS